MMEDNWYAPGPVHCRQMTEEERQYFIKNNVGNGISPGNRNKASGI